MEGRSISEALAKIASLLEKTDKEEFLDGARKLLSWMRIGYPYLIIWLLVIEEKEGKVQELLRSLKLENTWEELICLAQKEDPSQIYLFEICWSKQLDFLYRFLKAKKGG